MEPFQVSQQQETGAPSTSLSSGDLLLRARAQQQQQTTSLSADDEFHRSSRERSRSRGRLPTTSDTSRHRSLSQQGRSHNRRRRARNSHHQGPAATILEGFADSWETIMGGGIEMFRSEAMSLMQVRIFC